MREEKVRPVMRAYKANNINPIGYTETWQGRVSSRLSGRNNISTMNTRIYEAKAYNIREKTTF